VIGDLRRRARSANEPICANTMMSTQSNQLDPDAISNASGIGDALDECVRGSRLLGADKSLVLHGGGNTSVKAPWTDITGEVIDALYVKGSGWDLATIERAGFTPLPIKRLLALAALPALSDTDMMRELSAARLDPNAPQPSVEALLHAFLPHRAVQHSHADLILTLTNLPNGDDVVRKVFGNRVVVVPYVMPGFDLARAVAAQWTSDADENTVGMVLMNHGLFTFADTTAEAYRLHLELIGLASAHLDSVPPSIVQAASEVPHVCAAELAELRRQLSVAAGKPMIVCRHTDAATLSFVGRSDLADLATRGPVTPDHVIRTKRIPLVGRDIAMYAEQYATYFAANQGRARTPITMLDAAPRVVLDPMLGMLTIGGTAKDSQIAADIYRQSMVVMANCEDRLGGWKPLSADHLFDLEYWDLEQAKLRLGGAPAVFAGQIAIVTGAASGIGKACAAALLSRGAAVLGFDRSADVVGTFSGPNWFGQCVDVTNQEQQSEAIEAGVQRFGGVDIAVLAAGIFGSSAPIAQLDSAIWRSVMAVNLDAAANALTALHPLLALSPVGGRVVLVGSKNVHAPGAGAAAYSSSKAAITQFARIAAMEWAADGIRVNTVHPDAVFDTGLWNPELLAERAAKYSMTVEQYKARNLLGVEVTSDKVGRLVAELCSDTFSCTTGAQIHIDGGSDRTL
jgi:rhamnose utilization protein RhaD (predicted bifunctional aldolase and dehydrogenase)/NAD(P)-dependent dehydrogenase (short-subunit alcohol dehydrogenase family)